MQSQGQAQVDSETLACNVCGLVQQRPALEPGQVSTCCRCGNPLEERADKNILYAVAFSIASLALLIPANLLPILNFNYQGQWKENWIITGTTLLYVQGSPLTALVVFFTTIIAPLALHLLVLIACGSILFPSLHPVSRKIWGFLFEFKEWGMLDIFLIALGVASIKLLGMGEVSPLPGLYCIFAFVIVSAIGLSFLEPRTVFHFLREKLKTPPASLEKQGITCHHCGTVLHTEDITNAKCPVCHSEIDSPHANGMKAAWLYLHSATLLYLPANLFPVMHIAIQSDIGDYTVFGGIEYLWHHGDYVPAVIVFIASMIVPIVKILILYLLFLTYQSTHHRLLKTKIYLWVKAIGRWSMVDIFVLSSLVALGQLGVVATVDPMIGAIPFCGMVVFTMFAANAFDPKKIWHNTPETR